MKVTMQDVAKAAGVDKATVSRVLRGDARISEKTREKVMASVRELNYRPDLNARHLSTNKSGFVGVVVSDFNTPWFSAFIAGVDRSFSNSGYDILIKCTDGDANRAMRESVKLRDRNAEGVIWADSSTLPYKINFPVVTVGFKCEGSNSILAEKGELVPSFEVGAMSGRLLQKIVNIKDFPVKDIYIESSEAIEE